MVLSRGWYLYNEWHAAESTSGTNFFKVKRATWVVALGGGRRLPSDSIDFAVGFDEILGLGAKVDVHTVLGRVHLRDERAGQEGQQRFLNAYTISDGPAPAYPLIADYVPPTEA